PATGRCVLPTSATAPPSPRLSDNDRSLLYQYRRATNVPGSWRVFHLTSAPLPGRECASSPGAAQSSPGFCAIIPTAHRRSETFAVELTRLTADPPPLHSAYLLRAWRAAINRSALAGERLRRAS